MLGTGTTCCLKIGAAFPLPHCLAVSAVLAAPAFRVDSIGALVGQAESIGTVLGADTKCFRKSGAAFLLAHGALTDVLGRWLLPSAMPADVLAAPPSRVDGSSALVERADRFATMLGR